MGGRRKPKTSASFAAIQKKAEAKPPYRHASRSSDMGRTSGRGAIATPTSGSRRRGGHKFDDMDGTRTVSWAALMKPGGSRWDPG